MASTFCRTTLLLYIIVLLRLLPTCETETGQFRNQKKPNCMENGSVQGGLLIPLRASWGEALLMRTLPLIIHKACSSKVCTGTQQMVIKSCVLFYWSFLHSCKISLLLLLPFKMATMLIRNTQRRFFVRVPIDVMEKHSNIALIQIQRSFPFAGFILLLELTEAQALDGISLWIFIDHRRCS